MKKNKIKRTVIITGGNRGIGEYITRAFWEESYYILIGARTETGIVEELGKRVRYQYADVRDESAHMSLIKTAKAWTGSFDVYINCAGFSKWAPIDEVDEQFWDEMINTNLKGTFWGCKAAAKYLKKGGSIINISSLAGKRGSANNSVYCASKFGINGITQSLGKELGPKGIRINAVCPVYVKTDGLISALKENKSPAQGNSISRYLDKFVADNAALQRLPLGEEIANMCVFLASRKASAITGQCINVDCGVLPQ